MKRKMEFSLCATLVSALFFMGACHQENKSSPAHHIQQSEPPAIVNLELDSFPITFGAFSDIHGHTETLEDMLSTMDTRYNIDFYVLLGDYVQYGRDRNENNRSPYQDIIQAITTVAAYDTPTIVLPGNHDFKNVFEDALDSLQETFPHLIDGSRTRVLRHTSFTIITAPYGDDYLYTYSGYQATDSTNVERDAYLRHYAQTSPTLLLSHQPPYSPYRYGADRVDDKNVGSHVLASLIETYEIEYVLAGHIHSASGHATFLEQPAQPNTTYPQLILNVGSIHSDEQDIQNNNKKPTAMVLTLDEEGIHYQPIMYDVIPDDK